MSDWISVEDKLQRIGCRYQSLHLYFELTGGEANA